MIDAEVDEAGLRDLVGVLRHAANDIPAVDAAVSGHRLSQARAPRYR
jgi:hypothetical protein